MLRVDAGACTPESCGISRRSFVQLGVAGLMRRTADPYAYDIYAHLQPLNEFISICAFCLFAWQSLFIVNFFHSPHQAIASIVHHHINSAKM